MLITAHSYVWNLLGHLSLRTADAVHLAITYCVHMYNLAYPMFLHQMAGLIEEITRLQMPPYAIEGDQSVS